MFIPTPGSEYPSAPASPPPSWLPRTLHSQLVPIHSLWASTSHHPHSTHARYQLPSNWGLPHPGVVHMECSSSEGLLRASLFGHGKT